MEKTIDSAGLQAAARTRPQTLEILAPVGNREMLEAAVYAGADAVYLGLTAFNARKAAGNFGPQELEDAVSFCHARGVRVSVTLNTLLYDGELAAFVQAVQHVCNAGADAVIVQDLAAAAIVKACAPSLELHGSTQMAVHTLSGALQLKKLGFTRVILARELTAQQIAHITKNCGIQTEVFVHGALCMSVSGQCYISAFLGGRSGNRGMCAGTCRLPFEANGVRAAQKTHHLSLKDLSIIDEIGQLAAAGVTSVKIEGRLRAPEYVAAAVNACISARDGGLYNKELLSQVFSRSGFTSGFYNNKVDASMFGMRSADDMAVSKQAQPKLRELYRREYGRVAVNAVLTVNKNGAQVALSDGNFTAVSAFEAAAEQAQSPTAQKYEASLAKLGGTPFVLGDVQIINSENFYVPLSSVNEARRAAAQTLLEKRGEPQPKAFDEQALKSILGAAQSTETAQNTATAQNVESTQNIAATQNAGAAQSVETAQNTNAFETVKKLQSAVNTQPTQAAKTAAKSKIALKLQSAAQLTKSALAAQHITIVPLLKLAEFEARAAALGAALHKRNTVLSLPRAMFTGEAHIEKALAAAAENGYTAFEAQNIGHIQLINAAFAGKSEKPFIMGGFTLNITNTVAAQNYNSLGVALQTLSVELKLEQLNAVAAQQNSAAICYGYLPLMLTRACPVENAVQCAQCSGSGTLIDRMGIKFDVSCESGAHEIYNPMPLYMGDRMREVGAQYALLYFTNEAPARVDEVLRMFGAAQHFDGEFTRGLYYKGSI